MERSRVLDLRLATQRLTSAPLPSAAEVVQLLACVQSQERDHAFFSLGLRSRRETYAGVLAEYDRGAFLRTHILRPTWHFVLPEDLRWILGATSPRVLAGMAGRHRQLGLDDTARLDAGLKLLEDLLRDKSFRTRPELGDAFVERGSSIPPGERLGHLLLVAELRGLICSGPTKGVHHSYALVDEVVPPTRDRDPDEAVRELVLRFFTGHGPASIKDFTRWSSLTMAATREALADLYDALEEVDVDGIPHWYDPGAVPRRSRARPTAYLLPTYDEAVLTYPQVNFAMPPDHPYAPNQNPFWAWVVDARENVGMWKRRVTSSQVEVELKLAPSLPAQRRARVEHAAERLAGFLEREPVVTWS